MTTSSRRKRPKKIGGLPTWKIVLPIACILVILHVVIIGATITVSKSSSGLTRIMQTYSGYISDVTDLQAGSSFLSETSFSFLLHPLQEDGDLNMSPLVAYANEFQNPRRGDDIKSRFAGRDLEPAVLESVDAGAECAKRSVELQLHAIALTLSVYPAPPIPAVSALPLPALTAEETAMTDEQKLSAAYELITGTEYSNCKKVISDSVTAANDALRGEMQALFDAQLKKVGIVLTMLWVVTFTVIAVLSVTFYLLIRLLVYPLGGFVRGIDAGTAISEKKGLSEIRLVARSYNKLLGRRNALERVLRSAAETDPLTDLPNRYHLEQYLLQEEEEGGSIAFFLFDVNFLKEVNDKEGHAAGDQLLKRAAACLTNSFDAFPEAKCFRYGGDEFVAILKKCGEKDIETVYARFEEEQKKQNVSIAAGCAYAGDLTKTTIKELFDEADKKMYENKKRTHSCRENG